MPITHDDLGGPEDVARRVMALARTIAPGVDALDSISEAGRDAIAVLQGVLAELPAAGMGRVRSQSRNGTSVSLSDVRSAFSADARLSLRQICGTAVSGLPQGSFPSGRPISTLWAEQA